VDTLRDKAGPLIVLDLLMTVASSGNSHVDNSLTAKLVEGFIRCLKNEVLENADLPDTLVHL
jgi:hypothetical protein